jgi:hypothetical protein
VSQSHSQIFSHFLIRNRLENLTTQSSTNAHLEDHGHKKLLLRQKDEQLNCNSCNIMVFNRAAISTKAARLCLEQRQKQHWRLHGADKTTTKDRRQQHHHAPGRVILPPPTPSAAATSSERKRMVGLLLVLLLLKQWRCTFNALKFRPVHLALVFTSMGLVLLLFPWMLRRRMLPLLLRWNRRRRLLVLQLRTFPGAHHCMPIKMYTVLSLPDQH